jgi:hypothetical protein
VLSISDHDLFIYSRVSHVQPWSLTQNRNRS